MSVVMIYRYLAEHELTDGANKHSQEDTVGVRPSLLRDSPAQLELNRFAMSLHM